jgi:hypothetical protein
LKLNKDAVFDGMVSLLRENAKKRKNRANTDQVTSYEKSALPRGSVKTKLLHPSVKVEHLGDERVKIVKFTSEGSL